MAARMAVEDFGGTVLGRRIEILVADHQNKAEIAAAERAVIRMASAAEAIGDGLTTMNQFWGTADT